MDLRFARAEEQLDLNNPRFSATVADIASAIRGVPKDELESEEVRQHRRTVRTAWAAAAGLLLLSVAAVAAGLVAVSQSNEAQRQRDTAQAAAEAEAAAAANAEQSAEEASANAEVARARELAAAAVTQLDVDPEKLRWSPDGALIAAAGSDTTIERNPVIVWDAETGEMVHTWRHEDLPVFGIEFSPDGSQLLFGMVNTLHAFDTSDWSETTIWESEATAPGEHIHYTSDGSTIAAAAAPFWGVGDIVVFDTDEMTESVRITSAHDGGIRAMAISPDDTMVASVGLDGVARVHELATGDLVAEMPITVDVQAKNIQFLDNETIVVTAGDHGPMFQLSLDDSALLPVARSWLTRTFSDRECQLYRIDPCPSLDELRGG